MLLAEITPNLIVKVDKPLTREGVILLPMDLQAGLVLAQGSRAISPAAVVGHDHPVSILVRWIDLENLMRNVSGVLNVPFAELLDHRLLEQLDVHVLKPFPGLNAPALVASLEEWTRVEGGDLLERGGRLRMALGQTATLLVEPLQPEDIERDLGMVIETDPVGLGLDKREGGVDVAGLDDFLDLPERLAEVPSSLIFLGIRPKRGDDRIPTEVAIGVAGEVTEQLPGLRAGNRSRVAGSGFIFERARSEKIDLDHGGSFRLEGEPGKLAGGDDQRIPPTGPPPDEGIGWQGALPFSANPFPAPHSVCSFQHLQSVMRNSPKNWITTE